MCVAEPPQEARCVYCKVSSRGVSRASSRGATSVLQSLFKRRRPTRAFGDMPQRLLKRRATMPTQTHGCAKALPRLFQRREYAKLSSATQATISNESANSSSGALHPRSNAILSAGDQTPLCVCIDVLLYQFHDHGPIYSIAEYFVIYLRALPCIDDSHVDSMFHPISISFSSPSLSAS